MARQNINRGTNANDGTGDTLRVAGLKINQNFAEVYEMLGGDSGELSAGITMTDQGIVFEGTNVDDHQTTLVSGNPSTDITLSLPTVGTELISNTATQTMTNKTLTSPIITTPQINDTSLDHKYVFVASELTANRNVTLPVLGTNDTFVFTGATQTLANKTLTSPLINTGKIGTSINDVNGAELIKVTATATAVNQLLVANAATNGSPSIAADGDDANISLNLASKGTGGVTLNNKVVHREHFLTGNGAVDLTIPLTIFNSASALAITMADGTITGETKYFVNRGSGTATVTVTSLVGTGNPSTVAFAAHEAGFMMWDGANWHLASKTVAS
jgi:hypothetical protein